MFDTLDSVLSDALGLLEDGAADPGSAWRNLALATVGLDGTPQVRTVVLRRMDGSAPALEFHTDTRSAKHAELWANPATAVHGWDAQARVQLRVAGISSLHTVDDAADAAWAALRPESRATYRVLPGPGAVMSAPDGAGQADEAAARAVFCVVRLPVSALEWLRLDHGSQRRARFTWQTGIAEGVWLTP